MVRSLFHILFYTLCFLMGFTLTLGIIGSILYYIKPDSRKSTYFIWDLFIFGIITTLVILLTLTIISQ